MKIKLIIFPFLLINLLWGGVSYTPYATAKKYIGKGKPVMLELGTRDCSGCKRMNAVLVPFMKKHPNYRIFNILINEQPKHKTSAADIFNTRSTKTLEQELKMNGYPYQIFYDKKGREVYRHAGILSNSQLESICRKLGF